MPRLVLAMKQPGSTARSGSGIARKCAFGGPDLTKLYITTAAIGRDPHIDPMAGHLFAVETGIAGLPANVVDAGAAA